MYVSRIKKKKIFPIYISHAYYMPKPFQALENPSGLELGKTQAKE